MKKIVFCSFKGGTAKTSNALNIGAILVKSFGKKVLLVDCDAQANLSTGLGISPDCLDSTVSVLKEEKTIEEVIQKTKLPGLDIVPANTYLDGIESVAPLVGDLYAHERLKKSLHNLDYDYCFIDTPPSLGWLTRSAFYASDYSIICAIPEPYSILALNRLRDFHEHEIGPRHPIKCLGVILSFWDSRGATNEGFIDSIEDAFPSALFTGKIRKDISVSRAILSGLPVIEYDPKSRSTEDFYSIAKELVERTSHKKAVDKLKELKKEKCLG